MEKRKEEIKEDKEEIMIYTTRRPGNYGSEQLDSEISKITLSHELGSERVSVRANE